LGPHIKGRNRLRVYENRVLRRIFGPKREEVVEGWRRLHNEELHNFSGMIKSMRTRCVGHVACMGQTRNVYKILVTKPERKELLGTPPMRRC
jgi:hypothetical protein